MGEGERVNPAHEDFSGSPKLPPMLLTGVPQDARVMREEIFGPLLPLVPYRALDEAIAYVNARPRPLALYVFDHDRAAVDRVLAGTVSGGVAVNETIVHLAQDALPSAAWASAGGTTGARIRRVFQAQGGVYQSRINVLRSSCPP